MKTIKLFRIAGVISIWIIYIFLPISLLPRPAQFFQENPLSKIMYIFVSMLSIGLFYFNYKFAIPKLVVKRKYIGYAIVILAFGFLVFLTTRGFKAILSQYVHNSIYKTPQSFIGTSHIFKNALMVIASFALFYFDRYKQIETEKVKSELLALKAQINPHFFFNTLNIIYGQAITKSEKTVDSISKLSAMMRYVLDDANQEMVSLEKEIEYVKGYIDLQKMRLTDKTVVNFNLEGNIDGQTIPSLLFINIIENAFKHGVSTEKDTTIDIEIALQNKELWLIVKNDIPHKEKVSISSTNIGLENTKKRLKLLYGDNHSLVIKKEKSTFSVSLKIQLQC